MEFAIITDTHCGIRKSNDAYINNAEEFYSEEFFPVIIERGIKHIVHLGDIFDDRKSINFKALDSLFNSFVEKLQENGITLHLILGNHDTYFRSTNKLNSPQLMLADIDNVIIYDKPTEIDFEGTTLGLVPWLAPDNFKECMDFINTTKSTLIGGHFELSGFELYPGTIATGGNISTEAFARFDAVWSGHYHTKSSVGNITYLGAPLEFTWADAHDPKYFHIYDTKTETLEPIRNTKVLHRKIYYNDKENDYTSFDVEAYREKYVRVIVVEKSDPFIFDRFIDRLNSINPLSLKVDENYAEFGGSEVTDDLEFSDTETLLKEYVDAVETDLDKDEINGRMKILFIEAQAIGDI